AADPAQADRAVGAAADAGRGGGGTPLAHAAHRGQLSRLRGSGSPSPRRGRSSPRSRCPRPFGPTACAPRSMTAPAGADSVHEAEPFIMTGASDIFVTRLGRDAGEPGELGERAHHDVGR